MKLAKIGHALQHIAPVAASLMTGGTFGPAAMAVGKQVRDALDLHHESSHDEVEAAAVKADPTQLAKLKQIEADLVKDKRAMESKSEEVEAADRDFACKREIALHDKTPMVLTFCVTGSLMGCILLLFLKGGDMQAHVLAAITTLAGALVTGMHTILSYYFGGAKDAKATTEVLHRIAAEKGKPEA